MLYDSAMKSIIYPLAWPEDVLGQMKQAAKQTGLSTADIMRQSAKLGLPRLLEQIGAGRVTNVEPLPYKVARALYSKPDDDAEVTRVFMAAQSKAVEE
jgi:hypothetical protein